MLIFMGVSRMEAEKMLPADELRLGVKAEVSNAATVNANSMDLFLNIFPLLFEEIDDPLSF